MKKKQEKGLNPCFNGRYSQSMDKSIKLEFSERLNPCFNGRYSQSYFDHFDLDELSDVLILVLMEDTLRVCMDFTKAAL